MKNYINSKGVVVTTQETQSETKQNKTKKICVHVDWDLLSDYAIFGDFGLLLVC